MTSAEETGGATIESYRVSYSDDNGSTWNVVKGALGNLNTDTTATKTGLTGGPSYLFRVSAYNTHGFGEPSDEVSMTRG